ncbi:putative cell wall protein [Candida maltosa Xu316]|uniref:Putative cell wall protein n=1 Tax=Candida maltosa (strain Xu316) TaxID=1245528 RepID=M3J535_CANMX|nr:putative cell wall protein [Candida maltosa Xu316]
MKFSTVAAVATALFSSSALAKNVGCFVDSQQVATVDLDTGVCPFVVPESLPVKFEFVSPEEYDVEYYYSIVDAQRYFTDIKNAGRIINIPARLLYGTPGAPLFQVHLEKEPPSNSTAAIRRRLMKEVPVAKRDEVDDFIAANENTDGVSVDGTTFEVLDINESSSESLVSEPTLTSTASGVDVESTVTEESTKIITITSCSNDLCHGTTVPATLGPVTTTVSGETTIYTTYCPLSSVETVESTKVITITSCKENKCAETSVEATPSTVETVVEGTTTEYVTYCPLSETTGATEAAVEGSTVTEASTEVITVTACKENACVETVVPATSSAVTTTVAGETTIFTTVCPISSTLTGGETVIESTQSVVVTEGVTCVPQTSVVTSEGSTFETTVLVTISKATPATVAAESTSPAAVAAESNVEGTPAAETTAPGAPATVAAESTAPVTTGATVIVQSASTVAAGSSAAISTFEAGAASTGASFLALAMIPLAYFL